MSRCETLLLQSPSFPKSILTDFSFYLFFSLYDPDSFLLARPQCSLLSMIPFLYVTDRLSSYPATLYSLTAAM